MAAKDIKFGTDARAKMLRGVEVLAKTVKVTLVPTSPIPTVIRAGRPTRSPYYSKRPSEPTNACSVRSPRCVRSMPDWSAACSSRNTPNWRWFPSARRCAACIRPTRGSKSPRFPSSGICCSKCSKPSDPPANAANPATDARFPDARFTITAPSLRGRCRCPDGAAVILPLALPLP